jgi:predicted nucleic acid-binding protein
VPGGPLYLDTSAMLRALLEAGTTPDVERRIRRATVLVTSRLSLVEADRALLCARGLGRIAEVRLATATREIEALWARTEIWELTPAVCDLARSVAPTALFRTLDALHLATLLMARRRLPQLELLTVEMIGGMNAFVG